MLCLSCRRDSEAMQSAKTTEQVWQNEESILPTDVNHNAANLQGNTISGAVLCIS